VDGISAIQLSSRQVDVFGLSPIQSQQTLTQTSGAAQAPTGATATQGHHHHHRHGGGNVMSAAAQLLGMSTSDLTSTLQSGQSLASIASSKGVSQSSLVSALATALQGSGSNLTADQATQIATQMATRVAGMQSQPWAAGTQQTAANIWVAGTQQAPASTFEITA
jgi:hypothetical protein